MWLLVAGAGLALHVLKNTTGNKARPATTNQEGIAAAPQPPAEPPKPAPAQQTTPEVHVHVHLDGNQPAARPEPAAVNRMPQPTQPTPAGILNNPDHGIYFTTGSHLMFEHPRSAELLEQLDKMLFIAAHRDGDPFTVTTPLDTSRPLRDGASTLPPIALTDEGDFIDGRRTDLPPPDGRLWMLAAGKKPQPVAPRSPS